VTAAHGRSSLAAAGGLLLERIQRGELDPTRIIPHTLVLQP
jgi:hypothetical protein